MDLTIHNGFIFKLNQNDHTAVIIKSLNSYKALYIPRSIKIGTDEYLIIQIGEGAFQSSFNPKVITFPNNSELKYISKKAFFHSGIQKLNLPNSIEILEEGWCEYSSVLFNLTLPPSIKNMSYINDSYLIYHNNSENENVLIFVRRDIEFATIPSNIKKIGKSAFENCEKLKSVTFEQSEKVEEIGDNAFAYCKNLENISFFPESVKKIGRMSFAYCSKLKKIEIPENSKLQIISNDAFFHSSINDFSINNNIEYFEEGWCRDTNELTQFTITERNEHFKYINNTILIKITNTENQDYDYLSTTKTTTNTTNAENQDYDYSSTTKNATNTTNAENQDYDYSSTTANTENLENKENEIQNNYSNNFNEITNNYILLFARRDIETIVIPSNIKKIAKSAFYNCKKLKSVTFASSQSSVLDEIGENAFYQCSSLEKIESFPLSLKKIRKSAFEGCKQLKSIEFHPNCQLEIIEKEAFKGTLIEKLNLPPKIRLIEEGWCNGLNFLFDLKIDPKNNNYIYIDNKFLIDQNKTIIFARRDIESAIIPSNIKRIGKSAFDGCKNLKLFGFEDDSKIELEEIGENAFSNCIVLKSFPVFPSSLKKIDESAFSSCNKLESISFASPSNLEEIGNNAFYYCYSINKISSIPLSVKRIGKNAFRCLKSLKSVTFETIKESEKSSLIEIDDRCFDYCRELNSVVGIPISIKRIGNSAFENCVNLKELKFQTTKSIDLFSAIIEEIGNNAFAYCKNLDGALPIPESVKRIGRMSFAYCSKLKKIEIPENSKLQIISNDAFFHSSINDFSINNNIEYFEEGWCRDTNELTQFTITETNEHFKYINNTILIKITTTENQDYDYSSTITNATTTENKENEIQNNYSNNFNEITNNYILLFARRDIENVVIPSNINRISQCAFQSCSKLKSLVFEPSSTVIDYIGDSAFSYCFSLETIVFITNRIRKIGKFAFFQCKNLKSIFFESSKEIKLPDVLEEIDDDAFDFCENVEFVSSIPASVKTIGKECFRPLKKISSIEFLSNDVCLGSLCFSGCKSLCIASFANAEKILLGYRAFYEVSPNFVLYINIGCELNVENSAKSSK